MRASWVGWLSVALCGILLRAPATTRAQEAPAPKSPSEPLRQPVPVPATVTPLPVVEEPPTPTLWQIFAPRLSAGYTSGPGLGYSNGFSQINAFVPLLGTSSDRLLYVDYRGIASDNNFHWGNNIGMGYRSYNSAWDRIWGGWTAFDTRDNGFTTFTQMSGGLETIGRNLDARANGYLITGPQVSITNSYFINAPFFVGTGILAPKVINTDCALSGMDAEVGGPVPYIDRWGVRGYVGTYAFHGEKVGNFLGGQLRLAARISNNFDFNITARGDQIFGGTVAVGGAIRWGGVRRPYREPDRQSVFNRMEDPVERNVNVSLANHKDQFYPQLTDPTTGQPIVVIHVNNLAPPGGDGSVEHPLNTLAPAPGLAGTYGYILVDKGDGTTNGYSQGVTLQTGQHLFGNSMQFRFASNELGIARFPNTATGAPNLTNTAGSVVTLASSSEVAGVIIAAPGGSAITGTGINNFSVHDLTITTAAADAIALANVSGVGTVSNVTESNATGNGLNVSTTSSSSLTLGVTSSTFSSNTGANGNGINLNSGLSSSLTATVKNSTLSNNAVDGIQAMSSGSASLSLTVQNSTISGNAGGAVVANLTGSGSQSVSLSGNTISSGTTTGVSVTENSSGTLSFSENSDTVSVASGGTGINVTQTESGSNTATASLSNNTVSSATTGISVTQTSASGSTGALSASISSNTTNNNGTGISLTQNGTGSGSVTATVSSNTASNNTSDGIDVFINQASAGGGGAVSLTMSSNTVSNNTGNGLSAMFTGAGSNNVSATFSSNTATGNGNTAATSTSGLNIVSGNSSGTVTISSNSTSNNVNAGISVTNNGSYTYTVQSNTLSNDVTGGASNMGGFMATNNGSLLTMTLTSNSSTPSTANANTVGYLFINNAGTFTVNFSSGNNTGTTSPATGTSSGGLTVN